MSTFGVGVTVAGGVEGGAIDEFAFCCAPVGWLLVPSHFLGWTRVVFLGLLQRGVREANEFAAFG